MHNNHEPSKLLVASFVGVLLHDDWERSMVNDDETLFMVMVDNND